MIKGWEGASQYLVEMRNTHVRRSEEPSDLLQPDVSSYRDDPDDFFVPRHLGNNGAGIWIFCPIYIEDVLIPGPPVHPRYFLRGAEGFLQAIKV